MENMDRIVEEIVETTARNRRYEPTPELIQLAKRKVKFGIGMADSTNLINAIRDAFIEYESEEVCL